MTLLFVSEFRFAFIEYLRKIKPLRDPWVKKGIIARQRVVSIRQQVQLVKRRQLILKFKNSPKA